jgi:tetratricopeptide (TPR) repeat protein
MKNILTLLLFILIGTSFQSLASSTPPDSTANIWDKAGAGISIAEGKNLFQNGNTRGALIKFRESLAKYQNSSNANYWIAECQYKLHSYGIALKYCNIAIALNPKLNKDIYVLRGEAYHRMGKLDSALIAFEHAKEMNNKSNAVYYRIDDQIASVKYAQEQLKKSNNTTFSILPEPVNSKFHDYAPVLDSDGKTMYFTSRRNNTTGGTINPGDNVFFEDIFKATWSDSKNTWVTASNKLEKVNSAGHESVSDISADGLKMLVTINDEADNLTKKERKYRSKSSDVCVSMKTDQGDWNKPKLISKGARTSFYDGSATMTGDGNTIYYVSEKKGGKGSTDIYVMFSDDGKKWSAPKNVGATVNTPFRETTPIISKDGKYLFFASDGHLGYGGLDIFVSKNYGDNEWSIPVNLGNPINSVNDDTHFRYYNDLKKAFMSKMVLQDGKASRDIIEVDMTKFEMPEFKKPEVEEKK